jgi:hypothetical protein
MFCMRSCLQSMEHTRKRVGGKSHSIPASMLHIPDAHANTHANSHANTHANTHALMLMRTTHCNLRAAPCARGG